MARTAQISNEKKKNIKRYDETFSHEDSHRKGRPRVTSDAEDKFIGVTNLRNCSPNTVEVGRLHTPQPNTFKLNCSQFLTFNPSKNSQSQVNYDHHFILRMGNVRIIVERMIYFSFYLFHHLPKFTYTQLVFSTIAFKLFNLGQMFQVAFHKLPTISWVNFGPFLLTELV